MKHPASSFATALCACLIASLATALAYSPNPDLTAAGAIAALKTDANASPVYGQSYNLGATGLRGWIYINRNNVGDYGLQTDQSRQILVTIVGSGTPAAGVLAVDDVILGAKGGTGTVPAFTGDCRKAFGSAIGDAETTSNGGVLSLLRWRAGTTSTVSITLPVMGSYSSTAPFNCPKSALVLANARNNLVGQLLANPSFLTNNLAGAVNGLALLAGVAPGDPNYSTVQSRLQTYARSLVPSTALSGCDTWNWGYFAIFLSEYYLRTVADGTPDTAVLPGINAYTVGLAKGQSKYGTFGHKGAEQHADGSLHGSISWYGPVNAAGIPANIGIVIGKKALQTGGQAIDPEIDPAIERANNFFGWYTNKGSIPYGEHEPYAVNHASNGKDAMCAVLFGLQSGRSTETEYFSRMTTAGCTGREYGHTGQGFSYLWGALGSHVGGPAAVTAYLNNIRWHLDLERRTDGSFVYDGGEQYGAGTTSDGTYLGSSELYGNMLPVAWYVLTYSLPLQRIYLTGRDAGSSNTLDATKVAHAISAATYKLDCSNTVNFPVSRLMTDLGDYDPVVRLNAATELAARSLTTADENTLITMAEGPDANARMGACETLGRRLTTAALPALGRRLSDPDYWVRGKAANALRNFGASAGSQLTTMLNAFVNNATDPNVIVWTDPIQVANGYLSDTLFQAMAASTATADKQTLLYPALRAGLKQPDGAARSYLGNFIKTRLSQDDVNAVAPSIVQAAAERSPADRMFSDSIRYAALNTLAKYKIEEGIPLCLMVKEQTWHGDDWDPFTILQNTYRGAARDALPTLYKWRDHLPQFQADGSIGPIGDRYANIESKIYSTIAAIENDTAPPALNYYKSVTASASPTTVVMPSASTLVSASVTDLDNGTPNYIWTKVSGAGNVSFFPDGLSAEANRAAVFDTPGTYVLRVTAVDRSILDYRTWITYNLGYFDFQTYNEVLGGVSKEVTIVVNPDPNRAPVPQNQSITTPLNTAAAVTLLAVDPDNDAMTYSAVDQPTHGTLSGTAPNLTYTPAAAYTGPDSFTFKVNDGDVDSFIAAVTIDVGTSGNRRPAATNQAVSTNEDTAKGITLTGSDPDSNPLTYQIVSGPLHGTLTGTPPNLTYKPAPDYPGTNFYGTDNFTFTVSDGSLTSAAANVNVTIIPISDAPKANAQVVSVASNSSKSITLSGSDPEGYALTYSVASNPVYGALTGTAPNLTYTPLANFHGSDSLTFRVTDSEGTVSSIATVSITVVNDPPVASPQTLELAPDTSTPVTLSASDNCNDALTYAVVSQPSHGTLSGTAPNLTYTPAAGYTGADGFTFKANDGANDSAAATVSINVAAWNTLANIAAGAWSAGASWNGGVAPSAGGGANALLVFNTSSYSGTSSNDLAGTFQLNRWNIGASQPALTVTGNALSFAGNSGVLPQLNLSSANALSVSNNLALGANTTIGGTGAGAVTLSGVISGTGGLTKTTGGSLTLSGASTYTGGTSVSAGTFMLGNKNGCGTGALTLAAGTTFQQITFEGNSSGGALPNSFVLGGTGNVVFNMPFGGAKDVWLSQPVSGTGGITVQGGSRTLTLTNSNTFSGGIKLTNADNKVQILHANALGTGVFRTERTVANSGLLVCSANLSSGSGVTNPIDIAAGAYLNILADGTNHLRLSGPISSAVGTGSLYKAGTATLTLSGTNTYTGSTTVAAGTLSCASDASLGHGPVVINSGAKLNLNFSGTRQVSTLTLAGVAQANGTYGSTASPATNKNDTYFSGTGTITVCAATTTTLSLTGGSTPSNLGSPLTFTAAVAGNTPTGNVSFYAGATLLGTSTLNGSYQASLTTSTLAAGSYSITAQYAGDANNFTSTSPALVIQVQGGVTLPPAPGGLASSTGSHTVNLTWNAVGSAGSYLVKRSPSGGGPYTTIAYTSLTTYSESSLTNGTTYYYVVSASNAAGEGPSSVETAATPVNQVPVANAQGITTIQDTAKAVILTATDADGDALTYAIVGSPAHGTLNGTPPNLTYTPAAGYGGSDSFTFKANDGESDSATATVSITVVPWATWTNIAPGNWSSGASWSGGTAPAAGGASNGLLVFNTTPYAGTSTNDLAGNFQLNRWNLGSSLPALTVAGNTLSFVLNNGVYPQLNVNGANAATISNPLILTDSLALGGTGAGAVTLSGVISGFGGLTKTTSGSLTLSGTNTFSGGTTVTSGTFMLGNRSGCGTGAVTLAAGTTFQQVTFEGNSSAGALPNAFVLTGAGRVTFNMPFGGAKDVWLSQPVSGTGGISVQGGSRTLTLTNSNTFSGGVRLTNASNKVQILHANGLGTGAFRAETTTANSGQLVCGTNLASGNGVTNAVDIASGSYLNVFADGANHMLLSGPVTSAVGTGNLYKAGTATLTLSGTNTYTGTTTIAAGTLAAATPSSLGRGALGISAGAKAALNYTGSSRVPSLSLGGTAQANGSYGSTASPATYKNDTWFSGTGVLGVGPATTTTLALSAGNNPSSAGLPLTFTATVSGSAPTGDVVFYAGSTLLGTSTLNESYQANLTTSSLAVGSHDVTAVYLGNAGNAAGMSAAMPVQVLPNVAPVWTVSPLVAADAAEDASYSGTLAGLATDANAGTTLVFDKLGGPAWLNVAANGALTGTPANSNVGSNVFTVSVSDGIADPVQVTLNITVINTNDAPVFYANPISGGDATEDSAYSGTIAGSASDADAGANLTYAKVSGPAWLGVASNGALSGTPGNSDVGTGSFTVSVSDGIAAPVQATLNITVINTNDAPAWASNPLTGANATEDSAYSGTLTGFTTDVDAGATLTFAKLGGPAWLAVGSNGALSGTPANSDVGASSFTVSVSDGIAPAVTATLNITVVNTNDAPTWTVDPIAGTAATSGTAYSATLAGGATDADAGASLTFAKVSGPAWLGVAADGTLSGTPSNSDAGANSFTVSVSDGIATPVQATLNIAVTPALPPLLAYEPFDYPVGVLTGLNGGTGFAAAWATRSTSFQGYVYDETTNGVTLSGESPPLTWDGVVNGFPTFPANGARYAGAQPVTSTNLDIQRTLSSSAGAMAGADGVLWLSTVYHLPNRSLGAGITIGLSNGWVGDRGRVFQASDTSFIGVNGTTTSAGSWNNRLNPMVTSGGWTAGQYAVTAGTAALPGTAADDLIVVLKYTFGTSDKVEGCVFKEGDTMNEATFNANKTGATLAAGIDENTLNVLTICNGRIANAIDEIRIGDTFYGVTAQMDTTPPSLVASGIADNTSGGPVTAGTLVNYTVTFSEDMDDATVTAADFGNAGTSSITIGPVAEIAPGVFTVPVTPTTVGTLQLQVSAGADITDVAGNTLDTATAITDDNTVTVNPVNMAPVWTSSPVNETDASEDASYNATLASHASDANSDPLIFSKASGPAWLSVAANGSLSGTPGNNDVGANVFTVSVSDGIAAPVEATLNITVVNTNDAPVFAANPISGPDAIEDGAYIGSIAGSATDVDAGSTLTYAKVGGPAWLNVGSDGTLSGTPSNTNVGGNSFTVSVSDGIATAVTTLNITVINTNDPPTWAGNPITGADATEDGVYSGSIAGSANDVDAGANLTFAKVSGPAWLTVGANGTLSGTPANSDVGANVFTVSVNDGIATAVQATLNITVINTNDAPVFTTSPITAAGASEGVAYTGQTLAGRATDADAGDTITYSKVSGPAWLAVASNGALSGTPPSGSAGLNSFVVRATDSHSATTDATLQITVTGLPVPWVSTDIGTGMLAGSANYNAGTFTQAGSGTIGSTGDKLRFTYQTLSGDGEIIAKISALQNTGNSARVGVMIRDTLAANSKQILMGMTGSNAYRWDRRTATGGSTTSSNSSTGTVPNTWVRLVRSGTTITAYKSTNGTSWTSVGSSTNTTFASTCYIGLAVGSGSDTTLNTSQFSNVSVTP